MSMTVPVQSHYREHDNVSSRLSRVGRCPVTLYPYYLTRRVSDSRVKHKSAPTTLLITYTTVSLYYTSLNILVIKSRLTRSLLQNELRK